MSSFIISIWNFEHPGERKSSKRTKSKARVGEEEQQSGTEGDSEHAQASVSEREYVRLHYY